MALADITSTTGNTYVYVGSGPGRVIRSDLTNGGITTPKTLTTSHTAGTPKKAQRSLLDLSKTLPNADGLPKNVRIYMVIQRDVDPIISNTIVTDMVAELADISADSAIMGSFLKGGHY